VIRSTRASRRALSPATTRGSPGRQVTAPLWLASIAAWSRSRHACTLTASSWCSMAPRSRTSLASFGVRLAFTRVS
jgi:hypothetical protein